MMKRGREFLLAVYYLGTVPWRRWLRARLARRGMAPLSVLLYHRIAEDRATPWTTSRSAFRRHIRWLIRHCDVLSLGQLSHSLRDGRTAIRPAVAITFDDGYADNLRSLAELLQAGIPFTYFVTVENLRTGKPFQHDRDRGASFRPNTPAEIRALADAGVEIGSHGWVHTDLSTLDPKRLLYELQASKKWLEDLTGRPVTSLALPYGSRHTLTSPVLLTAHRVGYRLVCSAFGGYNIPFRQGFHIRRFHGDDSLWRLINRVTVDPRLMRVTGPAPLPEEFLEKLSTPHPGIEEFAAQPVGRAPLPVPPEGVSPELTGNSSPFPSAGRFSDLPITTTPSWPRIPES